MPSYRVIVGIGALLPGRTPSEVLPAARDAGGQLTMVEHTEVAVARGVPTVTVRFLAGSDRHASEVASFVIAVLTEYAAVVSWKITHRITGSWVTLRSGLGTPEH